MLVEAIFSALLANTNVQAVTGYPNRSDKSTGLYAGLTPDEAVMPALAYSQVSGMPLQESLAGTGALQTSRWRFSCYGSTYKSAKLLAQAVRQALLVLNGQQSAANVQVEGVWFRLEADEQEAIPHGTLYTTHVDFEINFLDLIS